MKSLPDILRFVLPALAGILSVHPVLAQEPPPAEPAPVYFVDGFHGGVYGHYPLQTYTKFMSDQLDLHPDWCIGLEIEPETWDSVKVATPAEYARFQRLVNDGRRVEYTNPSYAQSYLYTVLGESVIRQFEYGIKKLQEHFPQAEYLTYSVEEPCFTSCLPQVLKGFGFRYAAIKNPNTCWGGYTAPFGGELVNWIGPDGSSLLAVPRHAIEQLGDEVWTTQSNGLYPAFFQAAFAAGFKHPVGMCYQDAGWTYGPWLQHWKAEDGPRALYTTWRNYFENIASDIVPEDYVFSQEDVRGGLMWGTQVMQRIGRSVRKAENDVLTAEKMGVIARMVSGWRYDRSQLDEAWRGLLLSQHHDSWIVPYNNLKNRGTWADWICDTWTPTASRTAGQMIRMSQRSLSGDLRRRRIERDAPLFIRVCNTLATARSEVVSLSLPDIPDGQTVSLTDVAGAEVPCTIVLDGGEPVLQFRAEVPAYGFTTYRIGFREGAAIPTTPSQPRKVKVIENDIYRIRLDARHGGTIRSILDKRTGKEITAPSKRAFGEIRGYFFDEGAFRSSRDNRAQIALAADDGLTRRVVITGLIGMHPFVETITLREGDPTIDFTLKIDWQGSAGIGARRQRDAYNNPERGFYDDRYHLNIYFPTADGTLFKDAPFDVCQSRLESTTYNDWHDIKHNVILDWVSLEAPDGHGLGLLSDHTTSYVYGGGEPLALTVQCSGNGLWGRNYLIDRPTELHFALQPHQGGWEAVEAANRRWNAPLLCSLERGIEPGSLSLIDLEGTGYELSAAHLEGDAVLIRLYNATGTAAPQSIPLNGAFAHAEEVDLAGHSLGAVPLQRQEDGTVRLQTEMPHFGLRTFLLHPSR